MISCNIILGFRYTNYKGETAYRKVQVNNIFYGTAEPWHPEPQWLMNAVDLDKREDRVFAMRDMKDVQESL